MAESGVGEKQDCAEKITRALPHAARSGSRRFVVGARFT
jgi:hypothetical protein